MKTIRTSKKTKDEIWVLKEKQNNKESSQDIKNRVVALLVWLRSTRLWQYLLWGGGCFVVERVKCGTQLFYSMSF